MTIRKVCALFWLLTSMNPVFAQIGQVIQINTHFRSVMGNPTWLLILRDVDSGVVIPYIYDIQDPDNFWLAINYGRSYRVTASTLKFGPYAVIHNFCRLEDGILTRQSMIVTLSGNLTPYRGSSTCHIIKYKGEFPVATP